MAYKTLIGASCLVIVSACATPVVETPIVETPVETAEIVETVSEFDRALATADELVEAGNTPTAIDRLTQLLGDASLTDKERAIAHFERGQLRYSLSGYDVLGAVDDFQTVVSDYSSSSLAGEAQELLDTARGEATSLNFIAEQPETGRTDRFQALYRLGQHQDAIDVMLGSNLTPDNAYLVSMYQIGYLCDGEDLTGPAYRATEPDGTDRELRFCDFGK